MIAHIVGSLLLITILLLFVWGINNAAIDACEKQESIKKCILIGLAAFISLIGTICLLIKYLS
jgi:hypothetical protein